MEYIELGIGAIIAISAIFGNRALVRANIYSALKPLEKDTKEIKEATKKNTEILQKHEKVLNKYLSQEALYREMEKELSDTLGFFKDDIKGAKFVNYFSKKLKEFYASISVMWNEDLNLEQHTNIFVKQIYDEGERLFGKEHFNKYFVKINYLTKRYIVEIMSLEKSVLNNRKNRLNSMTLTYYYKILQTIISIRLKFIGENGNGEKKNV